MSRVEMERDRPAERVAAHHTTGTGVTRIGYPIGVRTVQVVRVAQVTPSMRRITLGGEGLRGFHSYQADDHVKLVFAMPDGTRNDPVANDEQTLDWPRPLPPTRKYTVRRWDAADLELDLDVVLHDGGLASDWARTAAPGDDVVVAGPPGAKAFAHTYDHYVLAVDTTALPAVARWLEEAPADVSADVLVDVDHAHERDYPLAVRDGLRVQWLDRSDGSRLAEAVASLALPPARTFLFAAGEAGDVKPLRSWARERVGADDALVTGYWKRGVAGLDD
ncbi:siderophore-interacting protein [Nocardioides campestrisoli]|uniref:siderophore-interacting protein n=1 Tax=Nocardioides campestrisoli TaxID=2736757 RepID=UPI001CD456AB|nr:siderophore-interacting protein [Nocardioides campestrisoli]